MSKDLEMMYDYSNDYEICLDEVGRGCMFGDVYVACVVLPKDNKFDKKDIKDSKKFTSRIKLKNKAEYIKENALFWHVAQISVGVIDEINILQAVMMGMHKCIDSVLSKIDYKNKKIKLIVDGNYFNEYKDINGVKIEHVTVKQGDGKYVGIAAASILAKDSRDSDIIELCEEYPVLKECYGLDKNVGYATKKHLEGIEEHGITQWHRKTFGKCRNCKKIKDIV
jgi:ribonuclease HII